MSCAIKRISNKGNIDSGEVMRRILDSAAVATLGEIVGATAVTISLLYLGAQIRHELLELRLQRLKCMSTAFAQFKVSG